MSSFNIRAPVAKEQVVGVRKKVQVKQLNTSTYSKLFYFPFFKGPIFHFPTWFAFLFIIFVITGSSNAVNLTDGLDGLAIGIIAIVMIALAILSYVSGNAIFANYLNIIYLPGAGELTVYCSAFVGAMLGFLWFNNKPAEIFMGDTGAIGMGGAIGVLSVLIKKEIFILH